MQQRARVTAADIARLAGVGRAAVSNWRKRYDTFPTPVGGTAASPQFDLDDVERWLADQGKLPAVADEDRLWRSLLAAAGDPAEALALAGEHLLSRKELPFEELQPALNTLASDPRDALEALWDRFAELPGQRAVTTPDALADLMVALAGVRAGSVLDPACGTGRLLRAAARAGATGMYGQDNDAAAARLAALWMAAHELEGDIRTGDSLRHDAFPDLTVDAVVANLPFGLTNWGHEELGYDRRWEFGMPPRTEPELAWAQHAISHLGAGGRAVLLMPPSAASRRAGRRIRGELLRRGAIRAIIALPLGAAAPHGVNLHLWVLERALQPASQVLLLDTSADPLDRAYERARDLDSSSHAVPVIDLLDDEVDLTPGRRGPAGPTGDDVTTGLRTSHERLAGIVGRLPELLPTVVTNPDPAGPLPAVTIHDLTRTGQVQLFGSARTVSDAGPSSDLPVLTSEDVVDGRAASGLPGLRSTPEVRLEPGDVVVPLVAPSLVARVVTEGGALLGRSLHLLRCDPNLLDPWFVAGYLRSTANARQTGSTSGTNRFDVRRAQVPRIPLDEQRKHGKIFRTMQEFDDAIHKATTLKGELTRLTVDGLATGMVRPAEEIQD